MDKQNLTMLTDFYELTMANGYFLEGMGDKTVYFDLFYRRNPENGGYVIAAGLEPLIDYLKNIKFTEDDLAFLKNKGIPVDRFHLIEDPKNVIVIEVSIIIDIHQIC